MIERLNLRLLHYMYITNNFLGVFCTFLQWRLQQKIVPNNKVFLAPVFLFLHHHFFVVVVVILHDIHTSLTFSNQVFFLSFLTHLQKVHCCHFIFNFTIFFILLLFRELFTQKFFNIFFFIIRDVMIFRWSIYKKITNKNGQSVCMASDGSKKKGDNNVVLCR